VHAESINAMQSSGAAEKMFLEKEFRENMKRYTYRSNVEVVKMGHHSVGVLQEIVEVINQS